MELNERFLNALQAGTVSIPHGMRPALTGGVPVTLLGRDALVARLHERSGASVALRVPATEEGGEDWPERYAALAEAFVSGPLASRLPSDIAVREHVLLGSKLPGITMEWIEGPTLLEATHRACAARNASVLTALATAFRDAINDLRLAGFRHADLTADNIIIRPNGRLAFIDLDTAAWPGTSFGVTGRGTPGYRHPAGGASTDTARDAFATLVIYVSLRLLAAYPELRIRFGDPPDVHGGCLLFSAWDLADPITSRLFAELGRTEATRGPELEALRAACIQAPDDATELTRVIPNLRPYRPDDAPSPHPRQWEVPAEPAPREGVLSGFKARLRSATVDPQEPPTARGVLETRPLTRAEPAPVWPVAKPIDRPRPRPPVGDIGNAMWRERLRRAVEQDDEPTVARLWPEIQRDPLAHSMALDVAAVLGRASDRRIEQEARRRRDDAVLALLGDAEARGLVLSPASRGHGRAARERNATRAALEQALATNDRQMLADLAVSGRLVELGEADRKAVRTVLRALERPTLERALASDDDTLVLLAYDEELFGGADALTTEERERIDLARSRETWLRTVREALHRRDASALAAAVVKPPPGAESRLSASARRRAFRLIERERALDQLVAAITEEDEPAILVALNTVERVGARIANRVDWPTLKRVVDRATLIEEIQAAAAATPVDAGRLAHLLPSARALGLASDPRLGELDLPALEREIVRGAHVRRLRSALARDDDAAIAMAATPDPHDAIAALDPAERARIDRALTARRQRLPFSAG